MGLLKFKGCWRSYQKRILDALNFHLEDSKLHVVAAPGAGKTTLGIEVISRLNSPTVILCPTNTIKNQWKERICSSFLDEQHYDIVSTDINDPKQITVITYQALLAAFMGKDENKETKTLSEDEEYELVETVKAAKKFNQKKADSVIKTLKNAKISVLCFDEAHHLRREWWKALTYLVEELTPRQTLALTGTPPYDAEPDEWNRYEELCGSIDEVISIPELVKNGDLCPHQDFIYFSGLSKSEAEMVEKYNKKVGMFIGKIFSDYELFAYLKSMPFLHPSEDNVAMILENPDFFVSIVSILKSGGVEIPKSFLKLFDAKQSEVPSFGLKQAKIFLNGFIIEHKDLFPGLETKIEEYYNMAHQAGLVQHNKIVLNDSDKIKKQISNSIGKLESIVEIVRVEDNSLGKDLRMVVLADYIRENDVDNSSLGVIPIWRILKNEFGSKISLGVLCGSIILLPKNNKELFNGLLKELSLPEESVSITTFKQDENYIKITPKENVKHRIVSLVTEMFNRGCVNVLIGTQSLLGEGWDAPCINSLILSSTVSSYMLSNQMRGRAIRTDKNNPDKVSNIWHLASVKVPELKAYICSDNEKQMIDFEESDVDILDVAGANLYDLKQLEKRFEGYEAPSYFDKHEIVNGISRIISRESFKQAKYIGERAFLNLNTSSVDMAKDRETTRRYWQDALENSDGRGFGNYSGMTTGVDVPKMSATSFVYESIGVIFRNWCISYWSLNIIVFVLLPTAFIYILPFSLIFFVCSCVWFLFKYLKNGSVTNCLKNIAIVMLETANSLGMVNGSIKDYRTGVRVIDCSGSVYVAYQGLSVEDNNFLMKCLQEFLNPIENPRYILVKRNGIGVLKPVDYFSVPSAFSVSKKDINIFEHYWQRYIGNGDKIIYARNYEGRKLLLKARSSSFSAMKRERSKKLTKWQ